MIERIKEIINTPSVISLDKEDFGDISKIKSHISKRIINSNNLEIYLTEEQKKTTKYLIINFEYKEQMNVKDKYNILTYFTDKFLLDVEIVYGVVINESAENILVDVFFAQ